MTEHKGEELKGRAKQATGAATGDKDLEREGKADRTSANVKQKASEAVDKVKDAFKKR